MENAEKKAYYFKKIILSFLFLVFWVISAIHIFKLENGKEMGMAVLYIVIFLPITVSILLEYEVFSLFVIIIYEIAMLLMGIIVLSTGLASKEISALEIAATISVILFSLSLVAASIQYLRNKTHTLKILCLIFGIIDITFVVISFIRNGEFSFETFYDFTKNVITILIFGIYIVTFPQIQLVIFKDEK